MEAAKVRGRLQKMDQAHSTLRWLRGVGRVRPKEVIVACAATSVLLGVAGISGWMIHAQILRQEPVSDFTTINPATAIALVKDGTAYVQAGAGVVADSDPVYEDTEARNKAMSALSAIAAAGTLRALGGDDE